MTNGTIIGTLEDTVLLAHGGGGELTAGLIRDHLLPRIGNRELDTLDDSAVVPWRTGEVVFSTDSYVVNPLEFPGGDIGRLAVCGTVNDIAVMGARPVALSLGLILEEGFPIATLDRIVDSIAASAQAAGITIATGDTKVVERRNGDGLFINTAGIGHLLDGPRLAAKRIHPGDAVLVSGRIAEHGLTIMAARGGIGFDSDLCSDATPLNHLVEKLMSDGGELRFLRDATRGGIAGVLADLVEDRGLTIEINEAEIPISSTARHAAEMLGLDPLTVANEGKIVAVVAGRDAERTLEVMRSFPEGRHASIIGHITDATPALVELNTLSGGKRVVQRPYGEELPRIC